MAFDGFIKGLIIEAVVAIKVIVDATVGLGIAVGVSITIDGENTTSGQEAPSLARAIIKHVHLAIAHYNFPG